MGEGERLAGERLPPAEALVAAAIPEEEDAVAQAP